MRRRATPILCAIASLVAFGGWSGPASADCAPPDATFSPRVAEPGGTIHVEGNHWATGCPDTVVCSNGCLRDACTGDEPAPRAESVGISIRRADGRWITLVEGLAASEQYRFDVDVPLPNVLEPGRYEVRIVDMETGLDAHMGRDRLEVVRQITRS